MLEQLRSWLNGGKDYTAGVLLYLQLGDNEPLKKLLKKSKTDYNVKRLQEELRAICVGLKSNENVHSYSTTKKDSQPAINQAKINGHQPFITNKANTDPAPSADDPNVNAFANIQLYDACKAEANKKYKEAMNARAVLFGMLPADEYAEVNKQDLVLQRSALAIKVVGLYNEASRLYDRADYVSLHGKLPDADDHPDLADMELIPEYQVKQYLDNRRKNYQKLIKKEATPDRVLIIQQHEKDIEILERRWHSLTQVQ